jgi:hypothetical protein
MECRNCRMDLPVYAKYCPNCGIQVHRPHVHHEIGATTGPDVEARARHLDTLFDPIYHEIELRMLDPRVDKSELFGTLRRIESEMLRGNESNPDKVERWLRFFQEMAPELLKPIAVVLVRTDAEAPEAIRQVAQRHMTEPLIMA